MCINLFLTAVCIVILLGTSGPTRARWNNQGRAGRGGGRSRGGAGMRWDDSGASMHPTEANPTVLNYLLYVTSYTAKIVLNVKCINIKVLCNLCFVFCSKYYH